RAWSQIRQPDGLRYPRRPAHADRRANRDLRRTLHRSPERPHGRGARGRGRQATRPETGRRAAVLPLAGVLMSAPGRNQVVVRVEDLYKQYDTEAGPQP